MDTVGFIGLGNIGSAVAANIGSAGYPLVVHDIREEAARPLLEAGARLAASPAEVAGRSDVVLTSLPGPVEVEQVAIGPGGIQEGIGRGTVYVDLSSSRPALIHRVAAALQKRGAQVIDAPLIVGKRGIANRSVQVLASGDPGAYNRVKPVLDALSDTVVYTGSLGTGSIIKLAHNLVRRGVGLAIGEGLVLGAKAGVDPQVLWDCMHWGLDVQMEGLRTSFPPKTEAASDRDVPASFTLALSRKDVGLATELGRELDVPMPIANLVEQVMIEGMNRGWGHRSTAALFEIQELAARVTARAPRQEKQT